jgi:DnaJ-class molecular chaperone
MGSPIHRTRGAHPCTGATAAEVTAVSNEHFPVADLYARLGVPPQASTSQINAAYRRLARALHPDTAQTRGGDPGTLQLIIEAHQILSDPQARHRYDSTNAPPRVGRSHVATAVCPVCRGAGTIMPPCDRCAGAGHMLTNSPWLQTPRRCTHCGASGQLVAHCGACRGSGRTSPRSSRTDTSVST